MWGREQDGERREAQKRKGRDGGKGKTEKLLGLEKRILQNETTCRRLRPLALVSITAPSAFPVNCFWRSL